MAKLKNIEINNAIEEENENTNIGMTACYCGVIKS